MDPYLGEIKLVPWSFAPRGWALCNGALLPIAQNTALFSLLGTYYGGNGVNTFQLPDLRGRVPVHMGSLYPLGAQFGQESVSLLISTMPAHTHLMAATSTTAASFLGKNEIYGTDPSITADFYAAPGQLTTLQPGSIATDGSGLPHSNMQPYLVMNYVIATAGIYPSRN